MAGVVYYYENDSSSSRSSSHSEEEEDEYEMFGGVVGYQFEPVRRPREGENGGEQRPNPDCESESGDRLGNNDWCTCMGCIPMPTVTESCCCLEKPQIVRKVEDYREMFPANEIVCITEHPGFRANCLDYWVLEVAYLQYKQQYQEGMDFEQNEMYRHTAYRQLVRWCWGVVGRHHRIPLPSCCVNKIRDTFPSKEGYTGFKWPTLK